MSKSNDTPGEFFVNHLFLHTLDELAQQANFQGFRKKAFAYTRAAQAIRATKEPLRSAEDAKKLHGIGPKIAQQLDFVLQKYHRDQGKKGSATPATSGKEMVAWFLQGLGEEYATLYSKLMLDKGYDNELVLANLTDTDLDQIGVTLPGHRRTVLLKSREMHATPRESVNAPAAPAPATSAVAAPESHVASQIIDQTLQLYPRDSLLTRLGISVHTGMGAQSTVRGLKVFQTARGGRLPHCLDTSFIEKNCSEANFIKGHALFKTDRVLLIVLNGADLYGEVQGRARLYHVILSQSGGRVTKALCECRYRAHGWCAHVAALLLAALECVQRCRETGEGYVQVPDDHVPVPSASDISDRKNQLAQQRERREGASVTRVSSESADEASVECDSSDHDSADLEEIDSAFRVVTPVKRRTPTTSKNRIYIPRYRSGAWAILITMYTAARDEGEDDDTCQMLISKEELILRARPLCDASFEEEVVYDLARKSTAEIEREISTPGGYTAWSAMTKLRQRGLVELTKGLFRLTLAGKSLAKKLFLASQRVDEDPREVPTPKRARDGEQRSIFSSSDSRTEPEEHRLVKRPRVDTCQTETSPNNTNVNNCNDITCLDGESGPDPSTVQSPFKSSVTHAPAPSHVVDVCAILASPHARVVLFIDNRELNKDTARSLKVKLTEMGVVCHARNLEVGDMMWVVTDTPALVDGTHDATLDARCVVLNVIVERKTIADLRASLQDGRYKEQKFRLKKSGITRVQYVIEGAVEDESFAPLLAALQSSLCVHEGLEPVRTKSEEDTATYLAHLTHYLQRQLALYQRTDARTVPWWSTALVYGPWCARVSKTKQLTLRDLFAKQLLCLKGLTPARVAALVAHYSTPRALLEAYTALEADPRGRAQLVAEIRGHVRLAPVSARVNLFYNHLGDNLAL